MQVLTNSLRNSYGSCHRKYFFQYEACRRPVHDAESLRFGALTHEALEQWYLNCYKGPDERMAAALAAIEANAEKNEADLYQVAMCRAMMRGYELVWGAVPMDVWAVEQEFFYPLYNPKTGAPSRTWELGGKIDAIAFLEHDGQPGKGYIIEHKTTSDSIAPESPYWVKLRIDGQVSAYFPGAKSKGFECEDLIYDVLHKPQVRPRSIPLLDAQGLKQVVDADGVRQMNKDGKTWKQSASEGLTMLTRDETPAEFEDRIWQDIQATPDKYFRRLAVTRSDRDMLEYFDDMWAVGREIADAQNSGRFPRNPRSCDNYGFCEYFDVCGGSESIDNPQRFKTTERHRELVEANTRHNPTTTATTDEEPT